MTFVAAFARRVLGRSPGLRTVAYRPGHYINPVTDVAVSKLFHDVSGYNIDKSRHIVEFLETLDSNRMHSVIQLPEGSGKSHYLSIVEDFVKPDEGSKHEREAALRRADASILGETYRHWQGRFGKHPVLRLNLKEPEVEGVVLASIQAAFRKQLSQACERLLKELGSIRETMPSGDIELLENSDNISDGQLAESPRQLTRILRRAYGERVIVLLDDYDTPLHTCAGHPEYKKIRAFLGEWLTRLLKGNRRNVAGSILTSAMPAEKDIMLSGRIPDVRVFSLRSCDLSCHERMMFTDQQVDELISLHQERQTGFHIDRKTLESRCATWPDRLTGATLWNPSSLIHGIRGDLDLRYDGSYTEDTIRRLLRNSPKELRRNIGHLAMFDGESFVYPYKEDSSIGWKKLSGEVNSVAKTTQDLISALVYTGIVNPKENYEMSLPESGSAPLYDLGVSNEAARRQLQRWSNRAYTVVPSPNQDKLSVMLRGMELGNARALQDALGDFILKFSHLILRGQRNTHHIFVHAIMRLATEDQGWESIPVYDEVRGGRSQVVLWDTKGTTAIYIAIRLVKVLTDEEGSAAAQDCLAELNDHELSVPPPAHITTIHKYGVVFYNKKCWVA